MLTDTVCYDEQTLFKVLHALEGAGVANPNDLIVAMQNAGILFRERGPEPRTWSLPAEPGPEVTAVRDRYRITWTREGGYWTAHHYDSPDDRTYPDTKTDSWSFVLAYYGPLTDASAEVPS